MPETVSFYCYFIEFEGKCIYRFFDHTLTESWIDISTGYYIISTFIGTYLKFFLF